MWLSARRRPSGPTNHQDGLRIEDRGARQLETMPTTITAPIHSRLKAMSEDILGVPPVSISVSVCS